jgi:hypothetical protein
MQAPSTVFYLDNHRQCTAKSHLVMSTSLNGCPAGTDIEYLRCWEQSRHGHVDRTYITVKKQRKLLLASVHNKTIGYTIYKATITL